MKQKMKAKIIPLKEFKVTIGIDLYEKLLMYNDRNDVELYYSDSPDDTKFLVDIILKERYHDTLRLTKKYYNITFIDDYSLPEALFEI